MSNTIVAVLLALILLGLLLDAASTILSAL